ncbi:Piwi-domain-containing protein [Teratosphaeria nubilosa]|uniref:Piwi-domain-containing protein n=1 Tax=Teratosphaeria nubilosa TaxID=161662 RepID=A0A6G1LM10_9PEZI|nr:Piwi-domain-containing protein [Teratosphaeria nubilosa]
MQNLSLNTQLGTQQIQPPRLSFFDETYARAPAVGSQIGRAVNAHTNFFDVDISQLPDHLFVYSYSFPQINGRDISNKGVKKELIRLVLQDDPFFTPIAIASFIATDWNAKLVSRIELEAQTNSGFTPTTTKNVTVQWANQAQPGQVLNLAIGIRRTDDLLKTDIQRYIGGQDESFEPTEWLSALNTLARKPATEPRAIVVKIGREKFFARTPTAQPWASGLRPRTGHVSSIRPLRGSLAMNLQPVASAFIEPNPLLIFMKAYSPGIRLPDLADWQLLSTQDQQELFEQHEAYLKAISKGLQVRYRYTPPSSQNGQRSAVITNQTSATPLGRLRLINGFGFSARNQNFQHSTLGDIFVEMYFNNYVMIPQSPLKYPYLPCVNTGSKAHPAWVPPELLCVEPHQPKRGQLGESDMALMLRVAQRLPDDNKENIAQLFEGGQIFDPTNLRSAAGLILSPNFKVVSARMLNIVDLRYGGAVEKGDGLRRGKWDLRTKRLHTTAQLSALGVIHFGDGPNEQAYASLSAGLTSYGLRTGGGDRPVHIVEAQGTGDTLLNNALAALRQKAKDGDVPALLIILPRGQTANGFGQVKQWADIKAGVPTVCVANANRSKIELPPFQANLALKFNVKLGGKNHILHNNGGIPKGTMIVGADVTHPGLGSVPHCPSAAAVVASYDEFAMAFPGSLRLQMGKEEMIEALGNMIFERLRLWKRRNGTLPSNILFYRDGVSECQFAYVKRYELSRIKLGCTKFEQGYSPNITLIVCGKRHHTRFYADKSSTPAWAIDEKRNFKPGLMVDDRSIRSPYSFDFYLQSHKALNGTARPCHYFVIHHEMNMTATQLQQITFNLCFNYATALTPISYASPAYYADRMCTRAGFYLRPLTQLGHPARPKVQAIDARMATDQKDVAFATEVACGWNAYWPAANRLSPVHDKLVHTMFYV